MSKSNLKAITDSWRAAAVLLCLLTLGIVAGCGAATDAPKTSTPPPVTPLPTTPAGAEPEWNTMEVAKAVMVTVDLDYGPTAPTIAQAINDIERQHQPADGAGRTFAILDAYGESTADGKLHMSMHVSSEKPGTGSLVFRRTGQVLWRTRIVPSSSPPSTQKQLNILIDNGAGTGQMIDGSNNPKTVLDAIVRDMKIPVRQFWPDGAEREVTFIYSACGCPVKVMARRVGDRTVRTKDLPVIFPDDPGAAQTIGKLMGW
ncbi:MAG TPA: hypothetical protein VF131_11810 [Blastocatellia bacterium]|nr:hypothetical protein [Blastocatellia bacterium]